MQLLRLPEVPISAHDLVFTYSRPRALLTLAVILSAAAGLVVWGIRAERWLGYYIAAVILVGLLLYQKTITARFRPTNWLVRMTDSGLFIKFRSYLNCHFSDEDHSVLFLPYREVRSARKITAMQRLPDRGEHNRPAETVRKVRLLEIELGADPRQLSIALDNEIETVLAKTRIGDERPSTRYHHFPVTLPNPTTLRIEWTVTPTIEVLLDKLTRHTQMRQEGQIVTDFVNLAQLSKAEQETRLLELALSGDQIGAIALARELYGYDLSRAKEFVEGLARKNVKAGK